MNLLIASLLFGLGTAIGQQLTQRLACHRVPHPMPQQFGKLLDHPWRLHYRDPIETLSLMGIAAGMTVLDLGCGTGTLTVEMARMVGATGVIHAVDLQHRLLAKAGERVRQGNVEAQVHFHHSGTYQLPVETNSVDLAIAVATLPQIPDQQRTLAELRRVLKPDARLVVSEELPDPAYILPQVTRQRVQSGGFLFEQQQGSLFCYSQSFINIKDDTIIDGTASVVSASPA